jgi:hypothetical protein
VLVNNAGVIQVGPLKAMTEQEFRYEMARSETVPDGWRGLPPAEAARWASRRLVSQSNVPAAAHAAPSTRFCPGSRPQRRRVSERHLSSSRRRLFAVGVAVPCQGTEDALGERASGIGGIRLDDDAVLLPQCGP